MKKILVALIAGASLGALFTGCSLSTSSQNQPSQPSVEVPRISGTAVDLVSMSLGETRTVNLSDRSHIVVEKISSQVAAFKAEATLSDQAFKGIPCTPAMASAECLSAKDKAFKEIVDQFTQAGAIPAYVNSEIAFFSFYLPYQNQDLFEAVRPIAMAKGVLVAPVTHQPDVIKAIKKMSESVNEDLGGMAADPGNINLSGIKRMNVPKFIQVAERDIGTGVRVTGSMVRVGVTDTGITYNHNAFRNPETEETRINYMADFTAEGRIYFNQGQAAGFEVVVPPSGASDELVINADVILTPNLPSMPLGDLFTKIQGLKIKVSPDLRNKLLAAVGKARLGVLLEENFQSEGDKVDINGNGKKTDRFYAILIPGNTPDQDAIYLDMSGTADFSNVQPVGDWNKTRQMVSTRAEKFGLDIKTSQLPSKDGKTKVEVRSASVVGFDPGKHGSHVSGIIAGSSPLVRGVAPEAQLQMNRVCSNNNGCNATEALVDLAMNAGSEVINMSLGGSSIYNDGYGVEETVINRLTSIKNVLFVISAGNEGPGRQTVGSPSTARLSLSVGASASKAMIQSQYQWPGQGNSSNVGEDDDFMLFFSSRGPTASGGFKPSLVAPGTEASSVTLNTAPGDRAGIDVFWGTSMAAPSATGAYALLLDAIKKYNRAHPDRLLTTEAVTLRRILIESAKPFDANRLEVSTNKRTMGQYTWIDQGTGIVDLVAAWKKVNALRDLEPPASVIYNGQAVNLDYRVVVSAKNPNGINYDGSREGMKGVPAFADGLYLSFNGKETLRQVNIERALPEKLASVPQVGELEAQLKQTADTFRLRTVLFGSDKVWLKAGTLDQLNCWNSPVSPELKVVGTGVDIEVDLDGAGTINPRSMSVLNVCVNRQMIEQLPPGDHGALIYAYRTVNGKTSPVASFIVPVYLTVPHKVLQGATAYEVQGSVKGFGVARNYIMVPPGTSLVKVTLEVPALKSPEDSCSGVELMIREGSNVAKSFDSRQEARIMNCTATGEPTPDNKRVLTLVRSEPRAGIWDLHVFGLYKYAESKYRMRVDYSTATSSVTTIKGKLDALVGSLDWTISDSSMPILPDATASIYELSGLTNTQVLRVAQGSHIFAPGALGVLRRYPSDVRRVKVTTGGSPGNDIDLTIFECPEDTQIPESPLCSEVAKSGGPTDVESAEFQTSPDSVYVIRVDGYAVRDSGLFELTESLLMTPEPGKLEFSGTGPKYTVKYDFSGDALTNSKIASHELFKNGSFDISGSLVIKTSDNTVLTVIPVLIKAK